MSGFYWTLKQLIDSTSGQFFPPSGAEPEMLQPEMVTVAKVVTDNRHVSASIQEIKSTTVQNDSIVGSRQSGVLFVAVLGERFDGHQFVEQAIAAGAMALMVSKLQPNCPVPQVLVKDTRLALGHFAAWHRMQMPLKAVVGITGSNGKTTTKTMVASLLRALGPTLMTQGNFNNDFGVPRTLLELRPEHEYAVIEMGANHVGEIAYLTRFVQPDIALLNNAAEAHLEGFGSLQGVIQGKGEIFEGLLPTSQYGVAIINADSPGIDQWRAKLTALRVNHVIEFASCDTVIDSKALAFGQLKSSVKKVSRVCWQPDESNNNLGDIEQNNRFVLYAQGERESKIPISMPLMGAHNAYNACASASIGLTLGLSPADISKVLSQFTGVAGRLQQKQFDFGVVIDDSYNANPASVKAGIDVLVKLPGESVLCLGAMAELGEQAVMEHQKIAEYAAQKGVKALFFWQNSNDSGHDLLKSFYHKIDDDAPDEGNELVSGQKFTERFAQLYHSHAQLSQDLIEYIQIFEQSLPLTDGESVAQLNRPVKSFTRQDCALNILIKGSRSSQMERVSEYLEQKFSVGNHHD